MITEHFTIHIPRCGDVPVSRLGYVEGEGGSNPINHGSPERIKSRLIKKSVPGHLVTFVSNNILPQFRRCFCQIISDSRTKVPQQPFQPDSMTACFVLSMKKSLFLCDCAVVQ